MFVPQAFFLSSNFLEHFNKNYSYCLKLAQSLNLLNIQCDLFQEEHTSV
jgi:hypothetical protein